MGSSARVCSAGPSLLEGCLWVRSHADLQVCRGLCAPDCPRDGTLCSHTQQGPCAGEGPASFCSSGGDGQQSSWTKKTPSSHKNLNLFLSLCWYQPQHLPQLWCHTGDSLWFAWIALACTPSGASWLSPQETAGQPEPQCPSGASSRAALKPNVLRAAMLGTR